MWTSQTADRIAFGQSLSVNALQMTAAVNTIANGGVRVDPSLVRGTATLDDGRKVGTGAAQDPPGRQRGRRPPDDADDGAGARPRRGSRARSPPCPATASPARPAPPSGSARTALYDGTFTVSFAGFAPADDPRFTIYVVVQNPRNGGGGGSVAGPAFSKLMGYTLRRYGVEPTGTRPSRLPVEW